MKNTPMITTDYQRMQDRGGKSTNFPCGYCDGRTRRSSVDWDSMSHVQRWCAKCKKFTRFLKSK